MRVAPPASYGRPNGRETMQRCRWCRTLRSLSRLSDPAGNLWAAEVAARELRGLSLDDALDLVALIARSRPDRLERAAIRWHGRLEVEAQMLTVAEAQFALAALAWLPDDPQARAMLRNLLRQASPTRLRRMQ
jgi:hypothetical protein